MSKLAITTPGEQRSDLGKGDPGAQPPQMSILRKFVMLTVIPALAVVCLAEVAGRIYLAVWGAGPDGRARLAWYTQQEWGDKYWEEFVQVASSVRYEPYVGWRRRDFAGQLINIRDGERVVPAKVPQDENQIQVWCFGASTMWGSGARDAFTVPAFLARLSTDEGLPVRVRNLAESGWVSTQEMIWLALKCRSGEVPDVVVFFDGVADVSAAFQTGRGDGAHSNLVFWEAYLDSGVDPRRHWLQDLALLRIYRWGLLQLGMGGSPWSSPVRTFSGEEFDRLATEIARTYSHNMFFICLLGETYGFDSLFFWQPMIASQEDYEATERQVRTRSDPLFFKLYERSRNAVMSSDLPPVDLTRCLGKPPPQGFFIDDFHTNEEGNAAIAEAIFEHLRPVLNNRDINNR